MGRGAAFADIDADGDLDVVMTTNGGPAYLFRNDLANGHRSVRLRLRGVTSNRDAIGALVRAKIGGRTSSALVKTGSSYLSQSELPITFGVGSGKGADDVTIDWPGGKREQLGVASRRHRGDRRRRPRHRLAANHARANGERGGHPSPTAPR